MGPEFDGVASHRDDWPEQRAFRSSSASPIDVASALHESGAQVLVNYLPV